MGFLTAKCWWDGSLGGNVLVQLRRILRAVKNLSQIFQEGVKMRQRRKPAERAVLILLGLSTFGEGEGLSVILKHGFF